MQQTLTILSGLIAIAGAVPYIMSTLKGKTKPNVVTWFTWTLLNAINAVATFSEGAWQTGAVSALGVVITGTITVLGLRQGARYYTRFDALCQVIALLGIVLWLITNQATMAVLMVLIVNVASSLPTLRHAYIAPHEEMPHPFTFGILGSALLLASQTNFTFVAVALPVSVLVIDSMIVMMIMFMRRRQRQEAIA